MPDSLSSWTLLQRRLSGEVILPGSATFEERAPVFNSRYDEVRPKAIVSCASPKDVSEAIDFATRNGHETALRSGGHSFAGHSSTRGMVIDVGPMRSVSVSQNVATVGAGARLGEVYDALQPHGRAIPAGSCPDVGVAGQALGGGLGILGRRYGTTSDHLTGAQIVLADGTILDCDEDHDADLFWALRGAGAGNFGVVTSLTFRTVPAPVVTNLHVAWRYSEAAAVMKAWQAWAPTGPDELAGSLKVTSGKGSDETPRVDVFAAFLGAQSDASKLLDDLVARVGSEPVKTFGKTMSFPETRRFWALLREEGAAEAETPESETPRRSYLFARNEFFKGPLPADALAALIDNFTRESADGEARELDFMPWSGAYNRVRSDATAFVHRNELFQLKHAVVIESEASMSVRSSARRWVDRSWISVHPWGSGRVFQNFADPDLETWPRAYYGENLERLIRIKARYDSKNVFRSAQSLPVM